MASKDHNRTARFACLVAGVLLAASARATPIFVNGIGIPGATGDQGGTSVNGGRLGFFSDIYYDRTRNEYWALSDRGPGGGTLSYNTRVERFTLDIDPVNGTISNFQVAQTIQFTDAGVHYNGLAPNPTNVLGHALDPEGFVVNPLTGNLYVSDEYGPSLIEFDRNGAMVKTFTTPDNLIPRNAANMPNYANDTGNTAGKTTNRGFEGLAISPDGRYTYASLQSAMLDEGAGNGTVVRIVKFDNLTGQAVAQYGYQLQSAAQGRGVSALVALNDHQFLVLERNNRGVGVGATVTPPDKKVYMIDTDGASDISNINVTMTAFSAVSKSATPYLDLGANTLAAIGNKVPEKLEGLTIGPRLNDGSYVILVGTDNDYSVTQNGSNTQFDVYFNFALSDPYANSIQCPVNTTTACTLTSNGNPATLTGQYALLPGLLYSYKASASDLAGFVAPTAVPEPGTLLLLVAGLGIFAVVKAISAAFHTSEIYPK